MIRIFIYVLLIALAIPWYWPENDTTLVFGFPAWALTSLLVLFITCVFTAWNFFSVDLDNTRDP